MMRLQRPEKEKKHPTRPFTSLWQPAGMADQLTSVNTQAYDGSTIPSFVRLRNGISPVLANVRRFFFDSSFAFLARAGMWHRRRSSSGPGLDD